ncbi:MAG: glycoside hydrolase family 20 zincin-like fold domain-containing protein, partial [Promethearchaeota archaeon]
MKWLMITGLKRNDGVKPGDLLKRVYLSPKPRKIEYTSSVLQFNKDVNFIVSDPEDSYLLNQLNEELKERVGMLIKIANDGSRNNEPEEIKQFIETLQIKDPEGYGLSITPDGKVLIVGRSSTGLFYGLQTLYQLMVEFINENGVFTGNDVFNKIQRESGADLVMLVPSANVIDRPKMKIRGISHDISRGQSPSVEALKRHVKLMSRFRLNLYQLYIEDMFQFKKYPQIGKGRGPLTREDIMELEEFAKQYHVEIMPVFQNLSHVENMLLDPEIKELGEYPGAGSFNLAHPGLHDFLSDLFSEIAPAFTSDKFHIGCDESWDVGKYASKDYIRAKGMARALLEHYTWVIQELRKYGKKTFFLYHDIAAKHDLVLEGLPKDDVVMVFWNYSVRDDWPIIDRIAKFGVNFVVSSSTLSWVKPFPDIKKSFLSNRKLIKNGLDKGAIGQINSSWGDNGQENFHENNLMQFCYSSAFSWNDEEFDDQDFLNAYSLASFGIVDEKLLVLFSRLFSIFSEFPSSYLNRWLGFLWRHPYHSRTLDNSHHDEDEMMEVNPAIVYKEDDMEEQRPLCQEIVSLSRELMPRARRNKKGLEYFEYAGLLLEYFIDKIQATAKVTNICLDGTSEENITKVVNIIEPLIKKIKALRDQFSDLWMHCANKPMLERIQRFFDWQIHWQQDKIRQVKAGIEWEEPYVESEWILLHEPNRTQDARYFRKTFTIDEDQVNKINRAHLQVIAGNHAEVYLNGSKLGISQSSYQNSAPVIDHDVEFWDIKDKIKPGVNCLAIKATCFFLGFPTINVYGEIVLENGSVVKVLSDASWRGIASVKDEGWIDAEHDDDEWQQVMSKGKPPKFMGEISKPRFDIGWKSKLTHEGFCKVLRANSEKEPISDLYEAMMLYNG